MRIERRENLICESVIHFPDLLRCRESYVSVHFGCGEWLSRKETSIFHTLTPECFVEALLPAYRHVRGNTGCVVVVLLKGLRIFCS